RQDRGDARVDEEDDDPHRVVRQTHDGLGQGQRDVVADEDQRVEGDDAHDRDHREVPLEAVDGLTDEQRYEDRAPGGDDGRRGGDEQVGDDDREGGVDHQQQQEDHDEEEVGSPRPDVALG